MNFAEPLLAAAAVVVILFLKRAGQISPQQARECLNQGALVIDVRSRGEFDSGHLTKAINLPLDELESVVPRRIKDRKQVLLLHCQSGMRSGMARRRLKALGYNHVYNLGSYSRAASIVENQ